jgi:hypothetical protein
MRYLVPSQEVHARLDQVTVPGLAFQVEAGHCERGVRIRLEV